MDFSDLPKRHGSYELQKSELAPDPHHQLAKWLEDAVKENILDFNAMSLATATLNGQPSCRTVLLKHIDETGLIFYTNYESRKGKELAQNPRAMVTLYWREQMKQVLVEGRVVKTSPEESLTYFRSRPRESQIGAWCSQQDAIITSRDQLEESFERFSTDFEGEEIPLPPFWGGYRLIPERYEFWQGGKHRLHDRFQYVPDILVEEKNLKNENANIRKNENVIISENNIIGENNIFGENNIKRNEKTKKWKIDRLSP